MGCRAGHVGCRRVSGSRRYGRPMRGRAPPHPPGRAAAGRAPQTFGAGVPSREAVERVSSAVPDGGSKEPEIVSSVSDCVSTMHLLMTWVR